MSKIKDLPKFKRPREKLEDKGPQALSDFELLLALIGSGNKQADVSQISQQVKKLIKTNGAKISYDELNQITGLGSAKIAEILAAFELAKRYLVEPDQPLINSAEIAAKQLVDISEKKQEYFVCLTLDGAKRLIAKRTITIGTLNANLIHSREVFADAITDRAAGIIVGHNHPSGVLRPSDNDIKITARLKKAGEILGINLLDHLIVTKGNHFSFADNGLL